MCRNTASTMRNEVMHLEERSGNLQRVQEFESSVNSFFLWTEKLQTTHMHGKALEHAGKEHELLNS